MNTKLMSTILVVDSEKLMSQLLQKVLQAEGYRVFSAATGQEAIDLLQAQPVDLLLSDLRPLMMDHHRLCSEMRKRPNIPVLVLTTTTTYQEHRHCLESAAAECMLKPFGLAEIRFRIRGLMHGSHISNTI